MSIIARLFRLSQSEAGDPIDHPALQRMSLRDLADIPLPREWHDPVRAVHKVSPAVPTSKRSSGKNLDSRMSAERA